MKESRHIHTYTGMHTLGSATDQLKSLSMVLNLSKQRVFPFLKWRLEYMCVRIGDMMERVNLFFNF